MHRQNNRKCTILSAIGDIKRTKMVAEITLFQNRNQQKRKSLNRYDCGFSQKKKLSRIQKKPQHIIEHVPRLIKFLLFPKTFDLTFTVKKYFTSYYFR